MIENQPAARPQSGLTSADTVFEVVDEGGVTRFVAFYSSKHPDLVGPVRSTRPYYAEIAAGFDPIYVFWGTAPYFYIIIERLGIDYLSPLGDDTGASSVSANFIDPGSGEGADAIRDATRKAPHNAYIRIPRMLEIAKNQGYSLDGGKSPFHFKEDAPENERGDIKDITLNFSQSTFKAEFKYDSASNTYDRYIAGNPNTDRETGEQISVNNVLVLITDIKNSGDEAGHMLVRTTQSGAGYFFVDGKVIEGTWSRLNALDPFQFKDKDGKTVLINRGQTWVSIIAGIEQLDY
ncbi:MAG: putative lipoprotein YerB precursor [Actinobacteria bacterium ADurb.Bin346]|nr:MAG: putative lipoprotein YerB precursor [Actinobacteria bacterium ADurb.Bin346]